MSKLQAYTGDNPFIFVSYKHEEFKLIAPLLAEMQKKYNVWWDAELKYGVEYDDQIAKKIKACTVFVYAVTEKSLDSPYCQIEVHSARDRYFEVQSGKAHKPFSFINVLMKDNMVFPDWFSLYKIYQMVPYYNFGSPDEAVSEMARKTELFNLCKKEEQSVADSTAPITDSVESETMPQPDFPREQDLQVICRLTSPDTCEVIGLKNGNCSGVLEIPEKIGDKTVTSIHFDNNTDFGGLEELIVPDSLEYAEGLPSRKHDFCAIKYSEYENGFYIGSRRNPYMIFMEAADDGEGVTIHPSAKIIYDFSMSDCSFSSITIPPSVKRIGWRAFPDSLRNVFISDLNKWCQVVVERSGIQNGVFPDNKKENCIYLNGMLLEDLVIPDTVDVIKDYVFAGCSSIKTVRIPSSVEIIERGAFENCNGLEEVSIARSYRSLIIGNYAFSSCHNLARFLIATESPEDGGISGQEVYRKKGSVPGRGISEHQSIFDKFIDTIWLESGTPSHETIFSESAFSGCSSLEDMYLNTIITRIEKNALAFCRDLIIYFAGTKSQWKQIPKRKGWDYCCYNIPIFCRDGNITSRGPLYFLFPRM